MPDVNIISISVPGKPEPIEVDPDHCHWYVERHFFASPDFYHYNKHTKTWEIVRVVDRAKYV